MHIVYTTPEFLTERDCGGLGNYINNISAIFSEKGHKVTILVPSKKKNPIHWNKNVTVMGVCPQKVKISHEILRNSQNQDKNLIAFRLDHSYAFMQKINEINKEHPVDIVQDMGNGFSFYRNRKIPLIIRLSDYMPYWRLAYNKDFRMDIKNKDLLLSEKLGLYSMRRADAIYAPSQFVAEAVGRKIHRNVDIIETLYNFRGIQLDDSLYREKYEGKKYLLFFGTLGYMKGVHNIAEIIHTFLDKYKDFYFVLFGRDFGAEYMGKGINMIDLVRIKAKEHAGRVLYLPHTFNKAQLYSVISHAYACVLPSRVDNLPNTCIEAMALKKIVIGTNGASFDQLIKDKENGLLIERDSPQSLWNAIEYLMHMPERNKQKMEMEASHSIRRLEPENVYENVYRFYKSVIAGCHR